MNAPLRVVIIGGGLGGLCLAQGLHKAGIQAEVYERDPTPGGWLRGYIIHVNPDGARALRECLPPEIWNLFTATAGVPSDGAAFLTDQLEQLIHVEPELLEGSSHFPIIRSELRRILMKELEEHVHFGKPFLRYRQGTNGSVVVDFADGTTASADVLVGADGSHSQVRRQYLPHAPVIDTGIRGIAGKYPLTAERATSLPTHLTTTLTSVLPAAQGEMIVAQFVRKINEATGGVLMVDEDEKSERPPDHLVWVLIGDRRMFGDQADVLHADANTLQKIVLDKTTGWHKDLRRLVTESEEESLLAVRVESSTLIADWQTSNVTLLGDAAHTMPPVLGMGANTAFRDAALLSKRLTNVQQGEQQLLLAIRDYELQMRAYGYQAVRMSVRAARFIVSKNRLIRSTFRTAMRVAAAVPAIKRLMFRPRSSSDDGST